MHQRYDRSTASVDVAYWPRTVEIDDRYCVGDAGQSRRVVLDLSYRTLVASRKIRGRLAATSPIEKWWQICSLPPISYVYLPGGLYAARI